MPYDEELETRIKGLASAWKNTDDKKMFGGICHLMNGNMFCGVYKDFLILRLGEQAAQSALRKPHVRPFDITGRPMKGWVMVASEGFKTEKALKTWLIAAKEFVLTLPAK
jgi:TfoX/Sxy family transcriptional regulator of competence genes